MCVYIHLHICTLSLHVCWYMYLHNARQVYMCVGIRVCFICVCRYIHIYTYTWKTPWVHTDTLRAHKNTCIRIYVCACGCMYTHVYMYIWKDTVCTYEFAYVCVYTCIYARRLHKWVCRCLNVCMSVYIYLHICTPSLHVYVYIFTCMVAEFTCVRVYHYIYAHRVWKCR